MYIPNGIYLKIEHQQKLSTLDFVAKKEENIIKNKVKRKFTGDTTKKLTPSQGKKAQHTNTQKHCLCHE